MLASHNGANTHPKYGKLNDNPKARLKQYNPVQPCKGRVGTALRSPDGSVFTQGDCGVWLSHAVGPNSWGRISPCTAIQYPRLSMRRQSSPQSLRFQKRCGPMPDH